VGTLSLSLLVLEGVENVLALGELVELVVLHRAGHHARNALSLGLDEVLALLSGGLHHLDVVASVFLQRLFHGSESSFSLGQDRGVLGLGSGSELLGEGVEGLKTTSLVAQTTLFGALSAGLLVQIGNKVLQIATSLVFDTSLVGLGEEDQGGVAAHAVLGREFLVLVRIDLGDDNMRVRLVDGGQFVVDGSEALAVTAPRGVELNEHILGAVEHDLVEVLRSQNNNIGGRGGQLDARASLAVDEVDDIIGVTTSAVTRRTNRFRLRT
jgi:hypothetical protein